MMDVMTKTLIFAALTAASLTATAQQSWTLKQCTDYAVEHNITVKQQQNAQDQRKIQLETSRWQRLPDLSASASQNFSFGRGLTAENTYSNTNTSSTSFSLGTSMPLFTGMQIPSTIKMNRLNLEAATQDLEKAKNDIRMQVASAYVQLLYAQEIEAVAHRQIAIDSMQVARLEALLKAGKASVAELSQQKATLAQSQLTATQAEGSTRQARLTLTQLLELPSPEGFTVVTPDVSALSLSAADLCSVEQAYAEAVAWRPDVKAEQLRVQSAEQSITVAKAGLYPQLSLSAGLGSNYYKTSGYRAESFSSQLKNNFSQSIGFNLNIPIFNRFSTRNNIRSAKIDKQNQQLQLENVQKSLYKEIQQAITDRTNARQKALSSITALASANDAFTLMQAKYEQGKANQTEFNEAKNQLMKAESDKVQAQYEYLYERALVDFYRGQELNF